MKNGRNKGLQGTEDSDWQDVRARWAEKENRIGRYATPAEIRADGCPAGDNLKMQMDQWHHVGRNGQSGPNWRINSNILRHTIIRRRPLNDQSRSW